MSDQYPPPEPWGQQGQPGQPGWGQQGQPGSWGQQGQPGQQGWGQQGQPGWGPPGQQPWGQGQGPGYGPPPNVPNHLVWAILSTLFCCLPLGIASIVYSTQVNKKLAQWDHAGAVEASNKAKNFAIAAAVTSLVIYALLIVTGSFGNAGM
jgi:hypothetical protein